MKRCTLLSALLLAALTIASGITDAQTETLTIDQSETAQISGFMEGWDQPILDKRRFDAAHRRLLVRFPGAAKKIAGKLEEGYEIESVELLLPFHRTELWPKGKTTGYDQRRSFGTKKMYRKVRPSWHAVGWALRHPWTADEELGPTFNAWINDVAYWSEAGAGDDESDHFPERFGPAEVSVFQARDIEDPNVGESALGPGAKYVYHEDKQPSPEEAIVEDPSGIKQGRMDVTPALTDETFGETLGKRLRRLADCGFMLRKWETYDFRFRHKSSYPWAASTGGRAIAIHSPSLEITLSEGDSASISVPEPAEVESIADQIKGTDRAGERPLAIPDDQEINKRLNKHGFRRREWMNDWQWERLKELRQYGGESLPANPEEYKKWVKTLLKEQPRYWDGWDNAERLLEYYRYEPTLPDYVAKHYFQDYWRAWLLPERPHTELVHPWPDVAEKKGQTNPLTYYRKTEDWRGNASFYRGYTRNMGTMNFNHTATMGALLGGAIIDSKHAIKDGRYGLENYPLRTWSWFDGSTQESIDHYYFALTLVAQKMFADFGPKHIDRMMGRSILAKTIDELASAYHPHLRHFLASSTRTGTPDYLLATQDGTQHVVHTLSREGALHDVNKDEIPHGMERFGNDVSPVEAQQMTMVRPWAPDWFANIVDEKPLPYKMTNTYKEWGHHSENPLWRRTYLGEHYGLASTDFTAGTVQILGQWRRDDEVAKKVQQLGTMDVIYGINTSHLGNPAGGWRPKHGMQATLHHENKMVVVTSPQSKHLSKDKDVSELKSTIAFYNYEEPEPSWKIYVDGKQVNSIPATAKTEQRITIHDGETYIGIIPLPATDLGGGGVRLHQPEPQTSKNTGVETQAKLAIESYNFKTEEAEKVGDRLKKMDAAYGGWIIEYGDSTEYEDFNAFQNHMENVTLETSWNPDDHVMDVTYESGGDKLEMGVNTMYRGGRRGNTAKLFKHRTVNGEWPYLEENMDRNTTLSQQGRASVLEKNEATLYTEEGNMAYLQTEPKSGTYVGFNPLPDLSFYRLDVSDDIQVQSDGRVGITRVMVRPSEQLLKIDHALKEKQKKRTDVARAMWIFGMDRKPKVNLNDEPLSNERIVRDEVEGETAWVVPLSEELPEKKIRRRRFRNARAAFKSSREEGGIGKSLFRDWLLLGPLPKDKELNPEQIDLNQKVKDKDGNSVSWESYLDEGEDRFGDRVVNLENYFGGVDKAGAYAYTKIKSDRDREAFFYVGSDDSIKIWVRGEKVLDKEASRAAEPDQNIARVQLKEGINPVLVWVGEKYFDWGFYFRVANRFGQPISEKIQYIKP